LVRGAGRMAVLVWGELDGWSWARILDCSTEGFGGADSQSEIIPPSPARFLTMRQAAGIWGDSRRSRSSSGGAARRACWSRRRRQRPGSRQRQCQRKLVVAELGPGELPDACRWPGSWACPGKRPVRVRRGLPECSWVLPGGHAALKKWHIGV
jgi:hypothetical protein